MHNLYEFIAQHRPPEADEKWFFDPDEVRRIAAALKDNKVNLREEIIHILSSSRPDLSEIYTEERLMLHAAMDLANGREVRVITAREPDPNRPARIFQKRPLISIKDDSRAPVAWPDRTPPVAAVNTDLTHPFFHQ